MIENNTFEKAYLKQLGLIKEEVNYPKYYKIEIAIPDPNKVADYITNIDPGLSINTVNKFIKSDIEFMKKFNAKIVKPWEYTNSILPYNSGYIWSFIISEWDLKDFLSYSFVGPANNSIIYNITHGKVYPYMLSYSSNDDLAATLKQDMNTNLDIHYFTIEETTDDIYEIETVTSDPDKYYKLNN